MNLAELTRDFQSEDECITYLGQMRWPSGVACLACESKRISKISSHGKTKKPRTVYECLECGKQFSVTCNTIFHDSHVPLRKWFLAISLLSESKKGMSSNQIARTLGVTYKTAWHMTHRIREAMDALGEYKLQGTVEIDETYLGGKPRYDSKTKTTRRRPKIPILGMVERNGVLHYRKLLRADVVNVKQIIGDKVSLSTNVMTDESVIYNYAIPVQIKHRHKTICHAKEYVNGYIHTNTIEGAFGLFKRGVVGSFHRLSYKHLHRYLSEFEFRWNNRKRKDMFSYILIRAAKSEPLPYQKLISSSDVASV